jgi:hypothetical protein
MTVGALFCYALALFALPGWTALALLPLLAFCLLAFYVLKWLYREASDGSRRLPESGELIYGFAGHNLRVFSDEEGSIWIRAGDVRHLLRLERSDAWMAQAYPQGFRRSHTGVEAWFIRPEVIRRHWDKSTRIDVNRFLAWMDRELVPLQVARTHLAGEAAGQPAAAAPEANGAHRVVRGIIGYFAGHWRGEHRLAQVVLSGVLLALLTGSLFGDDPTPADVVDHYRRYALVWLLALVAGTLLSAWWGVGVWRASGRWFGTGRSLFVGLLFAMGGMTTLFYAVHQVADFDRQMTIFSLAYIAADLTAKPALVLSPDGKRLLISGEMGFGSTRLVRNRLEREPGVVGIELDSPGGSAAEGLVLAALVRDRGLDTYVRAACQSACVLVFAGGRERLVAASARFGLHRSGVSWRRDSAQLSPMDREMGRFLAERGVSTGFIKQALDTPNHDIWEPALAEVMGSGLANGPWFPDGR